MGRLMIFLGVILFFVSAGILLVILMGSQLPISGQILTALYCEPNEQLTQGQALSVSGTTTTYYCEDRENQQRDITGSVITGALVGFLVPFALGMIFTFVGSAQIKRKRQPQTIFADSKQIDWGDVQVYHSSSTNIPPEQMEQLQDVLGALMGASDKMTLTERLQQLDEAYTKGLISQREYDKTRRAILDSVNDVQ